MARNGGHGGVDFRDCMGWRFGSFLVFVSSIELRGTGDSICIPKVRRRLMGFFGGNRVIGWGTEYVTRELNPCIT